MRQVTSDQSIQHRSFGFIALAALAGAVALIAAGPARANNDFQNGFEDQLGRIAAYGAVNLGLQILSGGYYPAVVPVPVAPVAYYGPSYGPYYRPYYGPRNVVVKYPKAYRHGNYWGPRNAYYGNQSSYRDGNRYHNDYDDDRGHRSHGKQHGKRRGNGHGRNR